MKVKKSKIEQLTLVGFYAITISMVMDVYEYPVFATSGFQLIFFLLVGGFLWFIPVALCSAEMATIEGWENGGIFQWVSNTLGERFGFVAVFFQWFQITVGFVTMLYFIIGALSYVFNVSSLVDTPWVKFLGIMLIFWALTFSQLGGTKRTEGFAKIGCMIGIILPAIVLFILSISYVLGGNPVQIHPTPEAFIPDFSKPGTLVVFIAFILSYMGVEASASYVNELENPQKNYPIAMFFVVLSAILLNGIGGLSIAAVVPPSELYFSQGILQTLEVLFSHFISNSGWLVKVFALIIALGVIGEISSWIVGPARGLYGAALRGILPPKLKKVNKKGVPVSLVMVQGVVVTLWAAFLTFGGGGNNLSFMMAISITVVIYLFAYLIFFISYFVLIFKKKELKRDFQVPGGLIGKSVIALAGFVTSILALFISFVPPSSIPAEQGSSYVIVLLVSFVVVGIIPFIIYHFHDKSLHDDINEPEHFKAREINPFSKLFARGEHHFRGKKRKTEED